MAGSFFLKDKQVPASVSELLNELRVKLDQRRKKLDGDNVIQFNRATQKLQDSILLDKYQQLAGSVAEYFFKTGEQVTFESYRKFMAELEMILESTKEGDK